MRQHKRLGQPVKPVTRDTMKCRIEHIHCITKTEF